MDPRSKNQYFSDILDSKIILDRYAEIYSAALKSIDHHLLENTLETIEQAVANENIIYSIGNGGSASIADHLCCDFSKGTFISGMKNLKSFSLSSNNAILTALSNDIGYEDSFSAQIEIYGETGDILFAVSSSGNSANIINACQQAKEQNMTVIGLTGFDGGKLRHLADLSFHVDVHNYGLIEDLHVSIMHILSQMLFKRKTAET